MTLEEKTANIEAKHDAECQSYDMCGCFDRLLAAVRGEPDPDGEGYRWPILKFTVAEPPQFGPETPWDYAAHEMNRRMYAAMFAAVANGKEIAGLSGALDNAIYFIGDVPDA